jgi:hypothetical protein
VLPTSRSFPCFDHVQVKATHTVAFVGDRLLHTNWLVSPSNSAPIPARTNGKKRKSTDSDVTKAKRAKATSAEDPEDPAERWKWINLSKPEMYAALPFLHLFFSPTYNCSSKLKARKLKCPTAVVLFSKPQPRLWKCGWTKSKCFITNARVMRRVTRTMGIRNCANLGLRQGRKTQK